MARAKCDWLLMSLGLWTAFLGILQYLIPIVHMSRDQPSNDFLVRRDDVPIKMIPSVERSPPPPSSRANMRGPDGAAAAASAANNTYREKSKKPNYHVVFSTSCGPQQNWESMVFFYHAYKVRQPGTVTRIVSGCSSAKEIQQQDDFFQRYIQPMRPHDFHLHHTPDYSRLKLAEGKPYKYMNKRTCVTCCLALFFVDLIILESVCQTRLTTSRSAHFYSSPCLLLCQPMECVIGWSRLWA